MDRVCLSSGRNTKVKKEEEHGGNGILVFFFLRHQEISNHPYIGPGENLTRTM